MVVKEVVEKKINLFNSLDNNFTKEINEQIRCMHENATQHKHQLSLKRLRLSKSNH